MKKLNLYVMLTGLLMALAAAGCSKEEASSEADKADKAENPVQAAKAEQAMKAPAPAEAAKPAENPHEEGLSALTVDELASMIDKEADKVNIFDANNEMVRKSSGCIPGAKMLSGSNYELSELPETKDSKLVFYCSSNHCGAAGSSARKAIAAGYSDVNVLPVGIKGWKEAGHKTVAMQ